MPLKQITDDIYRLAVPVPFHGLRWVNCYLIHDQHGWVIVDTGLNYSKARTMWTEGLATLNIKPGDIQKIILTHIHADHFGLAGWLQQFNQQPTPTVMSPYALEASEWVWKDMAHDHMTKASFWSMTGVGLESQSRWTNEFEQMRHAMQPYPDPIEVVPPGDLLTIGERTFRIIDTPGHSDGHIALFDESNHLMVIGDQVLAHITPNIGLWPGTPPNPLERYLTSLQSLRTLSVEVALPGHGHVINNWVERIDEIIAHHDERLDTMQQAVGAGANVREVSIAVFDGIKVDTMDLQFAVTETLAHLDYLVYQNRLQRHDNGVWWYQNQ